MRFCYFGLAAAATLLACTNAVSAESQLSQSTPQLATRALADAPTNDAVKRSLRAEKTYEEEDSLDSVDETEERGNFKGLSTKALNKLVKAKRQAIPFNVEKLPLSKQEWIVASFIGQNLNQKQLATKLGMKSVTDTTSHNFKFFNAIKDGFKAV